MSNTNWVSVVRAKPLEDRPVDLVVINRNGESLRLADCTFYKNKWFDADEGLISDLFVVTHWSYHQDLPKQTLCDHLQLIGACAPAEIKELVAINSDACSHKTDELVVLCAAMLNVKFSGHKTKIGVDVELGTVCYYEPNGDKFGFSPLVCDRHLKDLESLVLANGYSVEHVGGGEVIVVGQNGKDVLKMPQYECVHDLDVLPVLFQALLRIGDCKKIEPWKIDLKNNRLFDNIEVIVG